ncbi:MAG: class I SAM-dependent methyltransferase [Phycisphaerae bacterium]|nr:class I SAM-dependent methyltransferase [Phycisphaerae bacterium]
MSDYTYIGGELELFAAATHWKHYVRSRLAQYIGDEVLEVGAGIGGTTRLLCDGRQKRWVCLEPDAGLAERLARSIDAGELPACCRMIGGTLADVECACSFDTILYADVLEHIEDDAAELARAGHRLKLGGHVVVLAPAHQWLYAPFDKAVGHFRRYNKETLAALTPPGLDLHRLTYLDSVGLLASLCNRLLLKSTMPTRSQIAVWDRFMVRLSRIVDPALGYRVGKSVLGVWRKPLGTI